MSRWLVPGAFLLLVWLPSPGLFAQSDVFEDASAFGYDVKQESEDEVFFFESRFVDLGMHVGGRTFTGGLGKLFGTGVSIGGFLTYFFSRRFGLEGTINNSWHDFLIDGKRGTATLFDIIARAKYFFVSDGYSKALSFANPYIFMGTGLFIRNQKRSDLGIESSTEGPVIEFGGGFEIPLKERQVFLGIKPSYQLVFFNDESDTTRRGTRLDGNTVSFVASLTYSF